MSDILGRLAGQFLGGGGDNPLMGVLQQVLGGSGGLQGLMAQFQQAGLGDQFASWVGTGANLPVAPDQIAQALGGGQLGQLAQQVGIEPGGLAEMLSQFLPGAVDQLTPNGALSDVTQGLGGLGDLLGGFLRR